MTFASFTRLSLRNFGFGVSLFSTILNLVEPPSLAAQTAPRCCHTNSACDHHHW